MFYNMTNLTSADLSGLDTSNIGQFAYENTTQDNFKNCENLSRIKIGPKTFATNIFTGFLAGKGFVSENNTYGPFSPDDCSTTINENNAGWYNITNLWGTCRWDISNGILTIHSGVGADIQFNNKEYIPWFSERPNITKVIISESVVAPDHCSWLFDGMVNLTTADLTGLDTSNVKIKGYHWPNFHNFSNCPSLASINFGPKTLATNILTGLDGKALVSQSGGDPILPTDLPSAINAGNIGWYNVVDAD